MLQLGHIESSLHNAAEYDDRISNALYGISSILTDFRSRAGAYNEPFGGI